MADYIDRQAALNIAEEECDGGTPYDIPMKLEDLPAADVRENVSAKWENVGFMAVKCSNCHETFYELISDNFCPNCGAKMREKEDGE